MSAATEAADKEAQRAALACLDAWEAAPQDPFSWPLDGISGRGFGYWLTTRATEDWNRENRVTPCAEWFRRWLSDPILVRAAMDAGREAWRRGVVWGVADPQCRIDLGIPLRPRKAAP